jgi:hypothetical protein
VHLHYFPWNGYHGPVRILSGRACCHSMTLFWQLNEHVPEKNITLQNLCKTFISIKEASNIFLDCDLRTLPESC